MGDNNHRSPFTGEIAHNLKDFTYQLWVKSGGGFIKENNFRLNAEGTGDSGTLLLATGLVDRFRIKFVTDSNLFQVLYCPFSDLNLIMLKHMNRCLHHILKNGHMSPEVKLLKNHRQPGSYPFDLPHIGGLYLPVTPGFHQHFFPRHTHNPAIGDLEQVNTPQQSTFTGAG
jgi:hypothetical protein